MYEFKLILELVALIDAIKLYQMYYCVKMVVCGHETVLLLFLVLTSPIHITPGSLKSLFYNILIVIILNIILFIPQ